MKLNYTKLELPFEYPFTISKGTKTVQPSLIVALTVGNFTGLGEAPAISYYGETVEGMVEVLERNRAGIERFALTEPGRFWHFLHHLIPGKHFVTAALDMAAYDVLAQMRRMPLRRFLNIPDGPCPATDYTIGMDTIEVMQAKMAAHPMAAYKIKIGSANDITVLEHLRQNTTAEFRVDANEALNFNDTLRLLPELQQLGVTVLEQPLPVAEVEAMAELKSKAGIVLIADESCKTEHDVAGCVAGFHGINIKLTKCGGITPALRMIGDAKAKGLKVMLGSMNECAVGTAAQAHLLPLADFADLDGPLLLAKDAATGLSYPDAVPTVAFPIGLGIRFTG